MKRLIQRIFPLILAALIVFSIGWYLFEYDPAFTRDMLLKSARQLEQNGNHSAAVWLYNLAYDQSGGSDAVAIELAQQFKDIGNYSKAEYTLRNAIADGGSVDLYIALCQTYVEQGKLRDAVLMLENAGTDMKETLSSLRPAAPTASIESGNYNQYLTVQFFSPGGQLYLSTDLDYPSAKTDAYTGPITLSTGETTIFAVSVGSNGLVSPLVVFNYIIGDVVEIVTFEDEVFELAVRQKLKLDANQAIHSNTLRNIKELSLSADITSTADLKWFTNLETLTITGATLDHADAFSGLKNLKKLSVQDTSVSTELLQVIGSLANLQELTISNCGISSISQLAGLTQLTRLDLSSNAIRDISGIRDMHQLQHLDLSGNALIAVSALIELKNLEYLDISFNSLISTTHLSGLSSLVYLDVSSNALRSLNGIGKLTNLQQFRASYNELLDVNALASCEQLTYIDVSHNTLLEINVAALLPALEELYFDYNEVMKLPQFSKDCSLRIISGAYNYISSLKNLSGLTNLTHIYMDYNPEISSVASLKDCPNLLEVYVYGSKVRSVSMLTEIGIIVIYTPAT
ncbi:MAG: leucine-rich repeat domain-containing protein [Oscillospiraceae bacterium]|nr:leucine-rich repeat domain-containing protein [Oscillospiraceae bacterium]